MPGPAPNRCPTSPELLQFRDAGGLIRYDSSVSSPGDLAVPSSGAHSELAVEVIEEFLGSTPLFSRCDPSAVVRVAPQVLAFTFPAGTTIVSAGEQTGWLGIVFRGRASVRSVDAATGVPSVRETLRVGDHFGDIAALLGTGQPFAVVAEEEVTLLEIPSNVVEQLAQSVAGFGTALARRLSTRLLQASVQTLRRSPPATGAPVAPAVDVARAATPLPPTPEAKAGLIPFVHVSDYEVDARVLAMIPARLAQRHQLLPLEVRGNRLTVGMVNPRSSTALTDLRRVLRSVEPQAVAISAQDFAEAMARFKIADTATADGRHPSEPQLSMSAVTLEPSEGALALEESAGLVDSAEAEHLARRILLGALEREATAVHLDPEAGGLKVRFRVEGTLVDWGEFVPPSSAGPLIGCLEQLAGLALGGPSAPRTGRFVMRAGHREIDLTIASMPSARGVAAVVRVFEAAAMTRPLEQLFLEPEVLAVARRAVERTAGAVIVAGPGGSGRTSTLYAMIADRRRDRPDSSVRTVEDPVKVHLRGVGQAQAGPSADNSVAALLRSTLRLDPDVVMVGEIRDAEVAGLVLEAATTGPLVLSSLHARSALGALDRLCALGSSRALLAQTLELIVAQRLARRLCAACVTLAPPSPVVHESLVGCGLIDADADPATPLPTPGGCEACHGSGHLGRVAIVESLELTNDVRAVLASGAPLADLERLAVGSSALLSFRRAAKFFMSRQLIDPSEALLVVAE